MKIIAFFLCAILVCTAIAAGQEILINGDFAEGNTGFNSDYSFVVDGTGLPGQATYGVTTNPALWHSSFASFPDCSESDANMMVVNGSTTSNTVVWSQEVELVEGNVYKFSVCFASAFSVNPANLTFSFDGIQIANVELPSCTGIWKTMKTSFKATATSGQLTCVADTVASTGNDFCIDDISLRASLLLGDVNCDGEVNLLDVAPFVEVLSSGDFSFNADINQDGVVDLLDVAPFVALLSGG